VRELQLDGRCASNKTIPMTQVRSPNAKALVGTPELRTRSTPATKAPPHTRDEASFLREAGGISPGRRTATSRLLRLRMKPPRMRKSAAGVPTTTNAPIAFTHGGGFSEPRRDPT